MNHEQWKFINSFAPWLAALGTIAAVIVSLHLARRSNRIRLSIMAGIRTALYPGTTAREDVELIYAEVTNVDRRSATVDSLAWLICLPRGDGLLWLTPDEPYSSKLPTPLKDGDRAIYASPMSCFEMGAADWAKRHFGGRLGRLRVGLLRFQVKTSTGERFRCRPSRALRRRFLEMAQPARREGTGGGRVQPNRRDPQ